MARRCDQEMGGSGMSTEDFLQICMAKRMHGEVDFLPEWQLVAVDSNFVGPMDIRMIDGPREECNGFSFMANSEGLDKKDLEEPNAEEEPLRSADSRDSQWSLNDHRPLIQAFENTRRRATFSPRQGQRAGKISPQVEKEVGDQGSSQCRELLETPKRKPRKTTRRMQGAQIAKSGLPKRQTLKDSTTSRKVPMKIRLIAKRGAATKKWENQRKITGRMTTQPEEDVAVDGAAISDEDIHHRNRLLKEAQETWTVAE